MIFFCCLIYDIAFSADCRIDSWLFGSKVHCSCLERYYFLLVLGLWWTSRHCCRRRWTVDLCWRNKPSQYLEVWKGTKGTMNAEMLANWQNLGPFCNHCQQNFRIISLNLLLKWILLHSWFCCDVLPLEQLLCSLNAFSEFGLGNFKSN